MTEAAMYSAIAASAAVSSPSTLSCAVTTAPLAASNAVCVSPAFISALPDALRYKSLISILNARFAFALSKSWACSLALAINVASEFVAPFRAAIRLSGEIGKESFKSRPPSETALFAKVYAVSATLPLTLTSS